jgi:hypothetical protein
MPRAKTPPNPPSRCWRATASRSLTKRRGKEVYLDGSWAEMFQQKIIAWQVNTPTQEEVEDTLESYSGLAQHPVLVH